MLVYWLLKKLWQVSNLLICKLILVKFLTKNCCKSNLNLFKLLQITLNGVF